MTNPTVSLACGDYDRTRPLIEGRVDTKGLDLKVIALPSAERHNRFVKNFEFDVCELQVAQYLGLKSRGAPIAALPVFPHRRFNHSCVLIRRDSDIQRPEDLSGRRIGVQGHFNPIALWMRGVLQHDHGVHPSTIRWVSKGAENIPGWTPPSWLHIEAAPAGRSLAILLAHGELDGQILSDTGVDNIADSPHVRRLWPNYRAVEADYYRRTGIFPMRHLLVVKEAVLRKDPQLGKNLVALFEEAKQLAYRYWADHRRSSLAWFGAQQEEERALLGADPWPYSIEPNRPALETLLDYAFEQGLTERRLAIEEIFATLD